MFNLKTKYRLAKGALLKSNPLYVQFYITARCNLTCEQCNIIYANSDVRECGLDEIEKIAQNLSRIGTAIVLLTGGEPFIRKDLPEIIQLFVKNGIHVRMQTNGFASDDMLKKCVEYGGHDISISLDSLKPDLQDQINGAFPGSWQRAIQSVSRVTHFFPKEDTFAAFGCVLTPWNIGDIIDVVKFGTEIGWYTSLVPVHITTRAHPMNFRTYNTNLSFGPEHYEKVENLLSDLKKMKRGGYLLYDSDEYLSDINRFIRKEPIQWRGRNKNVCDSPNLYFAILPNGNMAVCCDWRIPGAGIPVQADDFPAVFKSQALRDRVHPIAAACEGCMFGSYPEMTISARYWETSFERMKIFLGKPPKRNWPLTVQQIEAVATKFR